MKREVRLMKAFGVNEAGLADLPHKISGRLLSCLVLGDDHIDCDSFPRGGSHYLNKHERSWKGYRRTQWKEMRA